MQPITVDFETFGIESRPAYPPKPVGVAIMEPGRKGVYHAFGHPTKNNTTEKKAREALQAVYRSGKPLLFHNAKFDLDVAETHWQLKPPPWDKWHDTLFLLFLHDPHDRSISLKPAAEKYLQMPPEERDAVADWLMAHGLCKTAKEAGALICKAPGDLVGAYAIGDVVRTYRLFQVLYKAVLARRMGPAYDRERRLLAPLLANERQGVRIDVPRLEADVGVYRQALKDADGMVRKRLGAKDLNVDSNEEVGELLAKKKIVTDWTYTKTGKRSVSKKNLTLEMFRDKKLAAVFGYRNALSTCLSVFMENWLSWVGKGDLIYTTWNQVRQSHGNDNMSGARTGRMSSKPPLMNIPKEFPEAIREPPGLPALPLVRLYMLPDKKEWWNHRDYNQQEIRILAHFEDSTLLEQYHANPRLDIHIYVQQAIKEIMGIEMPRKDVKILNFGKVYGMGRKGFMEKTGASYDEASRFVSAHERALPGVKMLNDEIKGIVKQKEAIRTWGGREYFVEPPIWNGQRWQTFEYKLLNYLIQGSAADCTKEAIIRYHEHPKRVHRFLCAVHDEINTSGPRGDSVLKECMESIEFDLPMLSDGKVGKNWHELTGDGL